jgi:hypothetical protein
MEARHETPNPAEVFRKRGVSMSHRLSVPSCREHRQSGQAIVTLTDGLGGRRDVLLGKFGTDTNRAPYARTISEWGARERTLPVAPGKPRSVDEVLLAFAV